MRVRDAGFALQRQPGVTEEQRRTDKRQRGVTQEKDERAERQDRRPKEVREKLSGRRSKGQGRHLTAPRHIHAQGQDQKKSQIPLASAKMLGRLGIVC